MEFLTAESLSALAQIVMIDLVLAGDNAIVIGLAAAGLPKEQRARAILVGIIAATVLRIIFAAGTQYLLGFGGSLLIAGGLLLLYVCWKMWTELRQPHHDADEAASRPSWRSADRPPFVPSERPRYRSGGSPPATDPTDPACADGCR